MFLIFAIFLSFALIKNSQRACYLISANALPVSWFYQKMKIYHGRCRLRLNDAMTEFTKSKFSWLARIMYRYRVYHISIRYFVCLYNSTILYSIHLKFWNIALLKNLKKLLFEILISSSFEISKQLSSYWLFQHAHRIAMWSTCSLFNCEHRIFFYV